MPPFDLGSELLNFIADRNLDDGDRLPTISELTDESRLGLSTSKVREQLEVARALGIVEVRSRTGTRMKEYSFTPAISLSLKYALARDPSSFDSFKELRVHVETAFWQEACELMTDEDRTLMRKCVVEARKKLNDQWIRIPHAEHRTFHLAVFKRLNNPFVIGLLEAYWDAYDAVQLNLYADYDYWQSVWDYHDQIITEIEKGNFEQAKYAFVEHTRLLRHQPRMQNFNGSE